MKEFFMVCKWDDYYPAPDIQNIVLVTHDFEEAKALYDKWVRDEESSWSFDNCDIYSSNQLPWSKKVLNRP